LYPGEPGPDLNAVAIINHKLNDVTIRSEGVTTLRNAALYLNDESCEMSPNGYM